jgi:hypothetical protein
MPKSILLLIAGTAVGAALIFLFYTAVRTRWPAHYASSSDDFGMIVNRTIFRYAVFALGPPYVVALLVGTTVRRAGGPGLLVAFLIGVFQVCYLRVRETRWTLRYNHTAMRMPTLALETALAVGALAAATLGGLGPGRLTFVVPPIDEYFKSLWGTILVAILAAIVIAKTRVQLDVGRLVNRSRKEVGLRLRALARSEATRVGADADLVEAILLTENLQRPKWFRQLERVKGSLFPRGSYGVMQVTADRPISDDESIVRAVEDHLRGSTLTRSGDGYPEYESLKRALTHYNKDSAFVELGMQIFYHVYHPQSVEQQRGVANGDRDVTTTVEAADQVREEETKRSEIDGTSKERAELLGQAARLCIVATMTLSTATVDELRTLNQSVAEFLAKQVARGRKEKDSSS